MFRTSFGRPPRARAWLVSEHGVLLTTVLVTVSAFLPVTYVSILAVQIGRDLTMSSGELGFAVAAYFAGPALLGSLGGRLADKTGWRFAATLSSVWTALCLAAIAALATSHLHLVIIMLVGGLGLTLAVPSGNLALSQAVAAGRQGVAFGIKQAAAPAASLVAASSLPLVALPLGWRLTLCVAASVPVTAAVASGAPLRRTRGPRSTRRVSAQPNVPNRAKRDRYILAGVGLATVAVSAISTFTVVYMVNAGLTEAQAATVAGIGSGLGLLARTAAGWLTDRYACDGLRLVPIFLLSGAAGLFIIATGNEALLKVTVVLAYAALWGWSGLFHHGLVGRHEENAGQATGAAQMGLMAGMTLGPLVFGVTVSELGYGAAWSVSGVCAAAGALLIRTGAKPHGFERLTASVA
jgi:MFS family permease